MKESIYSIAVTLLTAGVLSALISGFISYRLQSSFFDEQESRLKEKEKQDELRKVLFIKKAFLNEFKYNLSLINRAESGPPFAEHYFDTQGYSLFKENIALLEENIRIFIVELYVDLFRSNAEIKNCKETSTMNSVKQYYLAPKLKIESFITKLESEKSHN